VFGALGDSPQSQSHVTADGQSVSLGVEPLLGLMTRFFHSVFVPAIHEYITT
jgi:hypothetical protein